MSLNADTDHAAIQSLDHIRLRLQLLTTSLQSLQARIASTPVLPPVPVIYSSISVTLTQLSSLTDALSRHAVELSRISVTPNNQFPITTAESLLTTLLRTKVNPDTETWLNQAHTVKSIDYRGPADNNAKELLMQDANGNQITPLEWLQRIKDEYNWTGFSTHQEDLDNGGKKQDGIAEMRRIRRAEIESRKRSMSDMLRYSRTGQLRA